VLALLVAAGTDVSFSFDTADLTAYEATRGRGTFAMATRSLAQLAPTGCLRRAILVVTRTTAPHLRDTVDVLASFGIEEFVLMEVTAGPELFTRIGHRLGRSEVLELHRAHPRARLVVGHQCPVTLNVGPDGEYYVLNPLTDVVQELGRVGRVSLTEAWDQYARAIAGLAVRPSEVLEPAVPARTGDHR